MSRATCAFAGDGRWRQDEQHNTGADGSEKRVTFDKVTSIIEFVGVTAAGC